MGHALLAGAFIGLFAASLVMLAKEERGVWVGAVAVHAMAAAWQIFRLMQP